MDCSSIEDCRPEDFEWAGDKNYGCETAYDCYSKGLFKCNTSEAFKDFEQEIMTILFVQEGFENDYSYVVEAVNVIQGKLNSGAVKNSLVKTQTVLDEINKTINELLKEVNEGLPPFAHEEYSYREGLRYAIELLYETRDKFVDSIDKVEISEIREDPTEDLER